jgi:hypothetical protein
MRLLATSDRFVTVGQMVLANLLHVCYRASYGIGNPLTNSSEGVLATYAISAYVLVRELPTPSGLLREGVDYSPEQLIEGIGQSLDTFSRRLSYYQRKVKPFCNTSEEPQS